MIKCTPEEDQEFAEISKYCYTTKQRARTNREDELAFFKKPMKVKHGTAYKQRCREAIDKLIWSNNHENPSR